jgi:hypothetical protein
VSSQRSLFSLLLLIPLSVQAVERADPMRPDDQANTPTSSAATDPKAAQKTSSQLDLWVGSIQIGESARRATINGKLLQIGDTIRGAQLIAIEHDQVSLRRNGTLIKLKFLPRTIKQ